MKCDSAFKKIQYKRHVSGFLIEDLKNKLKGKLGETLSVAGEDVRKVNSNEMPKE